MSTITELNWLDREQEAIADTEPRTRRQWMDWWFRLANWWNRRHLSYGDGDGCKLDALARANKIKAELDELARTARCELCGGVAYDIEPGDPPVIVCAYCNPALEQTEVRHDA